MSATKSNFEFFFGFLQLLGIGFVIYFDTDDYIVFNLIVSVPPLTWMSVFCSVNPNLEFAKTVLAL